eukprot:6199293-Pleurochrysis_carterae.AAC.5
MAPIARAAEMRWRSCSSVASRLSPNAARRYFALTDESRVLPDPERRTATMATIGMSRTSRSRRGNISSLASQDGSTMLNARACGPSGLPYFS